MTLNEKYLNEQLFCLVIEKKEINWSHIVGTTCTGVYFSSNTSLVIVKMKPDLCPSKSSMHILLPLISM